MIGKLIKKIWENWPSEKTKIMAEDLNRYEDTLAEHDARLKQLDSIDTDMDEAKEGIKNLQNMSRASEYANNSVLIDEEEKPAGLIAGFPVFKKGYRIYRTNDTDVGTIVINDAIVSDEYYTRKLLNVDVAIRTSGSSGLQYSGNGYRNVKIEHMYNPLTHMLQIDYEGMGTCNKEIFVTVTYTRETA